MHGKCLDHCKWKENQYAEQNVYTNQWYLPRKVTPFIDVADEQFVNMMFQL